MKQNIDVFGWNWQHWSDLILNRWIFDWMSVKIIWEKQETNSQQTKVIIIPISKTKQLINKLIEWGQTTNIINFSWIMSTTPEEIRWNSWVENFHFLFWLKAANDLKCVLAFDETLSSLGNKIIKNCRKNSIQIIDSSIEEHDKKMAFIQWLNHLVRQLLLHSNIQTDLPIINTTLQTVQDMILLNPHMASIIKKFNAVFYMDEFNLSSFFNQLIDENLTKADIENFSTPAFIDTLKFMRNNRGMLKSENIWEYLKILKI